MSLANLTDAELTTAIANELANLSERTKQRTNEYGDLTCCPVGCKLVYGRHNRGVKRTEVTGWFKGFPTKRVVRVTSDTFESLVDSLFALRASAAKVAKKAADLTAAKAGGFKTVTAWKRHEKARAATEAAAAEAQAVLDAEARRVKNVARLVALGLDENDLHFVPVLDTLEAADADGFEVGREHARAALYAREKNTSAWQAYGEGELSATELLHRAERAQHRHEKTIYDSLLRDGFDRDEAREAIR